ncbi:selenide, water dikinase SelD [Carboxydocella sp. ULO1]|nr:selenide, water dikinase SelD [Carboxydocella sp. ULO1]
MDDPYTFGLIAAANSLSDIYAMGGKPLFALNVVGFPEKRLPMEVLGDILRGGADKAAEAGISIVGGHTVSDQEPKYGLVVTGIIHPDRIVTNAGARPEDVLYLTKPLGLGIITTAHKRDLVPPPILAEAVEVMGTLNKAAADAMVKVGVHACTDITGFGFLGHLFEMMAGSGTGAEIEVSQVPVLEAAWAFASQGVVPGGTRKNLAYLQDNLQLDGDFSEDTLLILADAQTSGGLLIAVAPEKAEQLEQELAAAGVATIARIGEVIEAEAGTIILRQ